MKALNRFIDRPLPVFLVAALVVFIGIWCLNDLPLKRAPTIDIPYSVIVVPYIGAAPDDIESEVTIELEEELNALDDLRHTVSISKEGVSSIFLEFEDRTDMSKTLQDVRNKVDLARAEFPDDVDFPIIEEISFDDLPIIFFTLTGDIDGYRLRDLADKLTPDLESVPGVSRVDLFGGYEREVRIEADPALLAQFDLTLAELGQIIDRQSRSVPAGQIRGAEAQRAIRATGEFETLEEIRALVVAEEVAGPIELRDVAVVRLGHKRLSSGAWYNGKSSVSLIVRRRPQVNTLETIRLLKERVRELEPSLPPGVDIAVSSDSGVEINQMLRNLGISAIVGVVLVVAVLFAMFGARQAILIASVLPFALLFTFIGLRVFDMEISNIAMFALILVLGLVVDGAIIVGEAIFTEREGGESPKVAAKSALARVGMPVIAADLTTIAAFMPMLLMVGVMGQFMAVMPKVVIFALSGSVFVDHLLLPAASARLGKPKQSAPSRVAPDGLPWVSPDLPRARGVYRRGLLRVLGHRWMVTGGAVVAMLVCVLLFVSGAIETIFLPSVDQGRFTVNYALPLGTSLDETNRVGDLIMADIADIPEVSSYVLTTGDTGALNSDARQGGKQGPEYGKISVDLTPRSDRIRPQSDIVTEFRLRMERYAGVDIDVEERQEGPPTGSALAVRLKGEDLDELAVASEQVQWAVSALPGALDVRVDYERSNPQVRVEIDRAQAEARFGVAPREASHTLLTAFLGVEVGRMWIGSERVDLRLQAPQGYGDNIENVRELSLRGRSGQLVPLGEVARVEHAFTENAIYRHDGMRAITVRADVAAGISSVAFESDARQALASVKLPTSVRKEFGGGEAEERSRSNASLLEALKWGVLAIYVIIAIQFNSIKQPFIVLFTIPLALIGVMAGLLVTQIPFSFVVFIGVVALTGIVVNDGIVMVDAINRKRYAGMPLADAIVTAAQGRLRPVILTTVTTIAGLLPLTIGISDGGEFWIPLGVAIISGLLVASALTLFVVPVLYSIIEDPPHGLRRMRFSLPASWAEARARDRAPASPLRSDP